ncbi:MAG: DUF1565 domain-containing protein [Planctomycetes bacterium]|nr:DUF1565 domain-containing protein [Planctomycetota bacterium]
MRMSVMLFVFPLSFVHPAFAAHYAVDAMLGNDVTGNGSMAAPWRTITRAHQAPLAPGDIVRVAAGVYDAALGESFPIVLKPGVQVTGAAPERTVVRGSGVETLFTVTQAGTTWFGLNEMTLEHADVGAAITYGNSGDGLLVLERLVVQNNRIGVRASDTVGAYAQLVLLNCLIRGNSEVGVDALTTFQGFNGVWVDAWGCTIVDNAKGIRGGAVWTFPKPVLTLRHSIVEQNTDDSFLAGMSVVANAVSASVIAESSLIGVQGNVAGPAGFLAFSAHAPHLASNAIARDLSAPTGSWPPTPLPPSWWGASFAPTFKQVADIDLRQRADAFVDAGCDERESPFVKVWGQPSVGGAVTLIAIGPPNGAIALYASAATSAIATPYGTWLLAPPFVWLGALPQDGLGHFVAPVSLPALPPLVGVPLYMQGHTTTGAPALTPLESLRFLP